ncbi:hypothetical protein SDRG_01969 [Saprolegnia diclina VS20]|uniref:RRM domain-containing protein n=1 Tax=Saprolegnia diclina (strain VS20) TaxID=1156394 RepID=T0QRZ1_SAPDV|nr:hypothetical protein SDRG_01969 [Saprolegnia diclina VS20]EQC40904.1 hypothetical protein SDRG_01969 [Saprolegnia diclina VS20]|eukprot:XP_008605748.1 hypothetical protein SDRG_01969 [Saprolegnia diclina VS20]
MAAIPRYRQPNPRFGKEVRPRAYTVSDESKYLILRNVPALGASDELIARFGKYGTIEEHRMLDDHDDATEFLDVVWLRYATTDQARRAKNLGVREPFYGGILQIAYAPDDETPTETRTKLDERRALLQQRYERTLAPRPVEAAIGPAIPSTGKRVREPETKPPPAQRRRI